MTNQFDREILIALECSGKIRDAFTALGYRNVWSCDLKPSEKPGKHIQGDVRDVIAKGWRTMIGHPVCKFIAESGQRWLFHPEDGDLPFWDRRDHPLHPGRRQKLKEAIDFFEFMWMADIEEKLLENPRPHYLLVERVGQYNQIIQPWMFGDPFQKSTCIWVKNLPTLEPEVIVSKGKFVTTSGGRRLPEWYSKAKVSDKEQTSTDRSRTFDGIANAIARQYHHFWTTGVPFGRLF